MKMTKNVVEKKELVPVITKETRYLLDLDFSEVRFLRDVCDRIEGDPVWSRRRIATEMKKALNDADVPNVQYQEVKDILPGDSIKFFITDNGGAD